MERLRVLAGTKMPGMAECSRCATGHRHWDRVGGKPICPNCQEAMIQGEAAPLIERAEPRRCVVCGKIGTIRFLTYPINAAQPIELDICGEHLQALVGRRLGPFAYHQLRRQLRNVQLHPEDVFLLHSAFYNLEGKALRPAVEVQ
jgi:hypothetical protein